MSGISFQATVAICKLADDIMKAKEDLQQSDKRISKADQCISKADQRIDSTITRLTDAETKVQDFEDFLSCQESFNKHLEGMIAEEMDEVVKLREQVARLGFDRRGQNSDEHSRQAIEQHSNVSERPNINVSDSVKYSVIT